MIASRRMPTAHRSPAATPPSSGPRWCSASTIRATSPPPASDGRLQARMPATPHTDRTVAASAGGMATSRPARPGSRARAPDTTAHVAGTGPAYTRSMAGTLPRPGVVVVSDIDLDLPDARRTHTLEVTRWLARLGFGPDLVSRGADPALDGVRYHAARPGDGTRERLVRVNRRAIGVLLRRRRTAGALYLRHDWAMAPTAVAARILGYRVVAEVNDLPYGSGAPSSRPRTAQRRV